MHFIIISNVCLKYVPKCMVSRLIFQKFSGEGLTEPPPQTPPSFFLGLRPRFGLRPQFSGASRPRLGLRPQFSGASRPRFGLSPSTFDWGSWFGPPQSKFLDPPVVVCAIGRAGLRKEVGLLRSCPRGPKVLRHQTVQ